MDSSQLHLITPGEGPPSVIEQEVFSILNEFLQPSTTLSATNAAKQLDGLYPQNCAVVGGKEEPEGLLWELWDVVIMVANQLPSQSPAQEKLADLVKAVHGISRASINVWSTDMRLWGDLPLLGASLTEAWHTFDTENLLTKFIDRRQHWVNYNAFVARLTRDRTYDAHWMAISVLRRALENEPDSRSTAYQRHGSVLATFLPVAAQWIKLCGPVLLNTQDDVSKGGRLWKGQEGMSLDRWNFWKQRFRTISEHPMASSEVRALAREAEDTMILQEKI